MHYYILHVRNNFTILICFKFIKMIIRYIETHQKKQKKNVFIKSTSQINKTKREIRQ